MFSAKSLFVCQHDNFLTINYTMLNLKLFGWCIVKKFRPSSNFKVVGPTSGSPPLTNVANAGQWIYAGGK